MLAELAGAGPQARTVLLYAHFDGQPVIPENWSQQDPFRPVVKRRDAQGKWQEVGRQQLQASPLDPELRVFARSASDDKAPIMMLLTAVDLLRAQQKSPAINVKVLLDPEEEMGSPSLAGMIERDRAAFAADAHGDPRRTAARLRPLDDRLRQSRHHAGDADCVRSARAAAQRALRQLRAESGDAPRATARIDEGRQRSRAGEGLLRRRQLCRRRSAPALTAVGDDEAALRKRIGIARAEKVGDNYQEALQYPSLNVRGMASAGIGAKAANIVPSEAVAEIDIRTTPTTDGRKLFELIKRHIEQQGYHLVDQAPTRRRARDARQARELPARLGASRVAHADGCGCRASGRSPR